MNKPVRKTILALGLGLLGASIASPGLARPVDTKPPADDAAYLELLPGFVRNKQVEVFNGETRTLNEGLVIRASEIKDGKIVIPPAGLYYTMRSGLWVPFGGDTILFYGKPYRFIMDTYERNVIRNVRVRKGQTVFMDEARTKGWQMTAHNEDPYRTSEAYSATFQIIKASGNFYGSAFPVIAGPKVTDVRSSQSPLGKMPEGSTVPTAENGLSRQLVGSSVATVGRSWVEIEELTATEALVKEFVTDNNTGVWLSPNDPVMGQYKKGDTFKVGSLTVTVTDVTDTTVTVDLGGKKKTLGPWTSKSTDWMYLDMAAREQFYAMSDDGKVIVHLNLHNPAGALGNGKANLVAYSDVLKLQTRDVWPGDNRFAVIPDT